MKKLIPFLLFWVGLVSCDFYPPPLDPQVHVLTSPQGSPIYWGANRYPISLELDANFSLQDLKTIAEAAAYWELRTERNLFTLVVVPDLARLLNPPAGSVSVSFSELTETPKAKHLGETRWWAVQGYPNIIHSMTVEVDHQVMNDPDALLAVMLHELGHVLLIDHDLAKTSVMYPKVNQSLLNILPKHIQHVRSRRGPVLK